MHLRAQGNSSSTSTGGDVNVTVDGAESAAEGAVEGAADAVEGATEQVEGEASATQQ